MIASILKLQRILCALDVERSGRAPLAHASLLSQSFGVPLDGLYVAAPLTEWGSRVERVRRLIAEHNAYERLDALLAPFAASLEVQSFVTRGANGDVIAAHASQHSADLIVIGGARKRVAGGSSSLAASLSTGPERGVLTVPGDSPACAMRRILLPVTTATLETPALKWIGLLARRFGASVTLMGVGPTNLGFWRGLTRRQPASAAPESELRLALRQVGRSLAAAGIRVESPPQTVLRLADVVPLVESSGFDLVVLGLPASSEAQEHALVERLRKNSDFPVLSIRARAALAARGKRIRFDEAEELSASA